MWNLFENRLKLIIFKLEYDIRKALKSFKRTEDLNYH